MVQAVIFFTAYDKHFIFQLIDVICIHADDDMGASPKHRLCQLMEKLRNKHQHGASWSDVTRNLKMAIAVSYLSLEILNLAFKFCGSFELHVFLYFIFFLYRRNDSM